jgi:hypothetical protein
MTPVLKAKSGRQWVYSFAVIAGANAGFVLGLLATLDWWECLMVMLALGALAGGAVFTFFEMRALN